MEESHTSIAVISKSNCVPSTNRLISLSTTSTGAVLSVTRPSSVSSKLCPLRERMVSTSGASAFSASSAEKVSGVTGVSLEEEA